VNAIAMTTIGETRVGFEFAGRQWDDAPTATLARSRQKAMRLCFDVAGVAFGLKAMG
jgi:hypothetical protein